MITILTRNCQLSLKIMHFICGKSLCNLSASRGLSRAKTLKLGLPNVFSYSCQRFLLRQNFKIKIPNCIFEPSTREETLGFSLKLNLHAKNDTSYFSESKPGGGVTGSIEVGEFISRFDDIFYDIRKQQIFEQFVISSIFIMKINQFF